MSAGPYDAFLLVSFGGPEKRADVIPFLERVLRGRNVPRERLLAVAEHYYHFDGRSPINDQNRALIKAIEQDFAAHHLDLPVYWGNRNWHPLLADTLRQMRDGGVRRAIAFVTSAFSSYSGCRQYRENIEAARQEIGPGAPLIDKLPTFHNHPRYIAAVADRARQLVEEQPTAALIFTAHSIPLSMAEHCAYEAEFREASRLVAAALGGRDFHLAYQSRSGPPSQPWLGPDINEVLTQLNRDAVVIPIGFVSDHMEVLYDLDTGAAAHARDLGVRFTRAGTAGTHPEFVAMIRELISTPQICPADCCLYPQSR